MKYLQLFPFVLFSALPAQVCLAQCGITGTTADNVCAGGSATLSATAMTGNTIKWYNQPTGGTAIHTGASLSLTNVTSTGIYYAEATGGSTPVKDSINTTQPNNGQAGAYFDVKPKVDLTVKGFNFYPRAAGTATVSVYYKTGTHVGSESNSGAWTLLGTSNSITLTANVLTQVPFAISQALTANQTYAFYVILNGTTLGYSGGTTLGGTMVSNNDIIVYEGQGSGGLFSTSLFTVRNFSGTINYEVGNLCVSDREPVVVTVIDKTKVSSQSLWDSTCTNLPADFYVKTDGVINTYRWQIYDNTTNDFVDITGNPFVLNGDTLNITSTPDTLNGAVIRCITVGQCGDDTSANMRVIVSALPQVAIPPRDTVIEAKPGAFAVFTVGTTGANISYQWQAAAPGGHFVSLNDGGIYKGVRTNRLTVTGISRVQDQFLFRCIVKGTGSCVVEPDTSEAAVLSVPPTASVQQAQRSYDITIYPNPVSTADVMVKIDNNSTKPTPSDYKIVDKLGRIVASGKLNSNGNTHVATSQLQPGVYILQVSNKEHATLASSRFTKL